ncbi:MAG: rRNA pseudouridine synthase [Planctomycetes bacterium]|nr:rRNA pseudouridine synthase [Planctomycetota bacterium]MCB9902976.1 rRNA pseudouridine synthase [Planctomycetota bacterium]
MSQARNQGPRRKPASRKKSAAKRPVKSTKPTETKASDGGLVRLNKFMADHGVASRRACDELITEGHVFIDGELVRELGTKIDPEKQVVEVDGEPLREAKGGHKRYYLLNKPAGVVCTNDNREQRARAIDLISDRHKGRIYTVGRLDEASKGLIILTNDGDFANRVMHPRYGVSKTYTVKLQGRINDNDLQRVREGVYLAEGKSAGARVVVRKRTRETSLLLVTLYEGMNREIRRMFASVGFTVVDLRRARIGAITDRGLKEGHWRFLTPEEINGLLAGGEGQEDGPGTERLKRKRAARKASGRGKSE